MDLWQWLTLAGAVMLSGISKTSFAGSLGLLAMPLLLLAFPADRALALLLPVLILCDAFTLQSSWKKWDLAALRFLLLPAIIGIVAASFVLLLVTIQQLQLFIGIGATLFALRYFYGNADLRLFAGAKAGISLGFISGVSSTLLHAGGPPLSLHLLARQLPPVSYIATSAVFFAVLNLLKVPASLTRPIFCVFCTARRWHLSPCRPASGCSAICHNSILSACYICCCYSVAWRSPPGH